MLEGTHIFPLILRVGFQGCHRKVIYPDPTNSHPPERDVMRTIKGFSIAAAAVLLLAGFATSASAASKPTPTKKPTISGGKGAEGAEGTASHEMSETSGTQKAEAMKPVTKKVASKPVTKKAATTSKK